MLYFGGHRLEVIADTARNYPVRSAAVGIAGGFLVLPAWIIGMVALAVSIVGIPILVVWVPLFPLLVALAALGGFMALSMNVGDWVRTRNLRAFEWAREENPVYRMAAGLLAITMVFLAANAISMAGPWLGFLRGMLATVGGLAVTAMIVTGFGAVLITRGGQHGEFATGSMGYWDTDWSGSWGGSATDDSADVLDAEVDLHAAAEEVAESAAEMTDEVVDATEEALGKAEQTVDDVVDEATDAIEEEHEDQTHA
jgi:hypothetical protein